MTEEEFFSKKRRLAKDKAFPKPLYKCPQCGKESVCRDLSVVWVSNPIRYRYYCHCGYSVIK